MKFITFQCHMMIPGFAKASFILGGLCQSLYTGHKIGNEVNKELRSSDKTENKYSTKNCMCEKCSDSNLLRILFSEKS